MQNKKDIEAAKLVKSINNEYIGLLLELIGDDDRFGPNITQIQDTMHSCDESVVIPYENSRLISFQYKILRILKEVSVFWQDKVEIYHEAIANLPGITIYSQDGFTYPAIYFDTVIIEDNLLYSYNEFLKNPIENSAVCSKILRYYKNHLYKLIKSDSEVPMVAFYIVRNSELEKNIISESYNMMQLALSELLINPNEKEKIWYWDKSKPTLDLSSLFNITKLKSLFTDGNLNIFNDIRLSYFRDFISGKMTLVNDVNYKFLIEYMCREFVGNSMLYPICSKFRADPMVPNMPVFKLCTEIRSEIVSKNYELNKEFSIAQCLNLPDFKWTKDLSAQDIVCIRESGGLDVLRDAFGKEHKNLKYSKIDDFDKVAASSKKHLMHYIDEHNKKIDKDKADYKKKIGLSAINFTGSVALGIISVAAPPLACITIPLAVWSVVVGGNSAKDLINDFVQGKAKINNLDTRPVGIISKYIDS